MKIGKDKILHALVCMAAVFACGIATFWISKDASFASGIGLAIGLGFGKEYGDSKASGNKWDWLDIAADLIGTIIGAALLLLFWVLIGR